MKYIVICGGTMSGLGKGVTASSTGAIMKNCGYNVTTIKIDPYYNVDAGTISPLQHGQVYVLDDGAQVDLDLGNYERFLDVRLTRNHNLTSGKLFYNLINYQRRGDSLGDTVQVVPHVINFIIDWIDKTAAIPVQNNLPPQICIIEIGGTVGDLQSAQYYQAIRQLSYRISPQNLAILFVTYVPVLEGNELKTKVTQHGVKTLQSIGLKPDFIICRCNIRVKKAARKKIAMYSNLQQECVLTAHNVDSLYEVPLLFEAQNLGKLLQKKLNLQVKQNSLDKWAILSQKDKLLSGKIQSKKWDACTIVIVGKYTDLHDAYTSVIKAFKHAAIQEETQLDIKWIQSTDLEDVQDSNVDEKNQNQQQKNPKAAKTKLSQYESDSQEQQNPKTKLEKRKMTKQEAWKVLESAHGILIPGGFGERGIEGKVLAAKYARQNKIPYLGICLGMQVMVIEFCRNVLTFNDANSSEFNQNANYEVISYMPQIDKQNKGGTMRLGLKQTTVTRQDSIAYQLYNKSDKIKERHRHRYQVNTKYVKNIQEKGLLFTGHDSSKERMEICQLDREQHPFYFGVQFHPEFLSRPLCPSPPFVGLVKASLQKSLNK